MGNQGVYQRMTTIAKKVGGPVNLFLLVGTVGAGIYKGGEIVAKELVELTRSSQLNKQKILESKTYCVIILDKSNEEIEFTSGDQFRVLETDGDAVLIEKINDTNNPYCLNREVG